MNFLANLARRGAGLAPLPAPRPAGPVFEAPVAEETGIAATVPESPLLPTPTGIASPAASPKPSLADPEGTPTLARGFNPGRAAAVPPEPRRGDATGVAEPSVAPIDAPAGAPEIQVAAPRPGLKPRANVGIPSGFTGEVFERGVGEEIEQTPLERPSVPDAVVPAPRLVLTATAPDVAPSEPAVSVQAVVPVPPALNPPPVPALPVPRTADAAIPAVPRIEEPAPAEPRVEVRIGRVELKVDRPSAPPPAPPRERPTFSDYAGARRGLRRGWY